MRLNNLALKKSLSTRGRKHRGFTLVELIVVLAIIAILAAAGIITAIGYINRSKFDQNTQNAITVYQTAQSALAQKSSNGTIDLWVHNLEEFKGDLFDDELENKLADNKEADQSIRKSVALTYNPRSKANAEDKYLYDLLSKYFYDSTIFSGTISLELDVTATYGNGRVNYSARVISAFYSKENTSGENSTGGWDSVRIGEGYSDEFPDLPQAKGDAGYIYRRTTSYVGWFNGTAESISSNSSVGGVFPVFLPQSTIRPLEGHIVAGEVNGYLFNLRNGETLDVSWAIFDKDGEEHEDHDENIVITLKSAGDGDSISDAEYGNNPLDTNYYDEVQLIITRDALDKFLDSVKNVSAVDVYEHVNNFEITRSSRTGYITVEVRRNEGNQEKSYPNIKFPITISKVTGDGRKGTARGLNDQLAPYYEYRLSLDAMMVRADEESIAGWSHFSIDRLIGYTPDDNLARVNPRNIFATISGTWNYFDEKGASQGFTVTIANPMEAARAIDDTVYQTDVTPINGKMTYCYMVSPDMGRYDSEDSISVITGNTLTGRCVVNTLFGDYIYNDAISGTNWNSEGGSAVITSFRHLYNIRKIHQNNVATFTIVKDLDWYVHDIVTINGAKTDLYSSEVRVFKYANNPTCRSTVENGTLKIVSFPALGKLYPKHTLTSVSDANRKIYSINNVQMRVESFRNNKKDDGYGLICNNSGTVYNIYTDNLNFVVANVPDGSVSDYSGGSKINSSICPDNPVAIATGGSASLNSQDNRPVGGLIGRNFGTIGLTGSDDSVNTISMRNSIVMAGQYWKAANYKFTGGVIGVSENTGSLCGVIELRGSFAVVGAGDNVSGIVGEAKSDVGARLVVDGNSIGHSEFTLPISSSTGRPMTCVLAGSGLVSGGMAWFQNHALTYGTEFDVNSISHDQSTGKMSFPERNNDYQIDITIPSDGLIIKFGNLNDFPVGGAIGQWVSGNGNFANIRVHNDGYIIADKANNKNVSVGGAVGVDSNCTVGNVYFEIVDGKNSRVGSATDNYGPLCSGGAIGWIEGTGEGRTITINAVNDGTIVSRGSSDGQGSGGAIGGITSEFHAGFNINVVNDSGSMIIGTGNDNSNGCGVGGAIGGMGNKDSKGATKLPSGSTIFVENSGTLSGKCHVGGAIGNAPANEGNIYTVNFGKIEGTNFVGGSVGRITYPHSGSIRSILNGATITGDNFIGGTVGRLSSFSDGASVGTVVAGNSSVIGSGSIVGGSCGDVCVTGDSGGNGDSIRLTGDSSTPTLTVNSSGECIGGVIGILRANRDNYLTVAGPDQSATNKLIVNVDGGKSVGGLIGKLRSSNNGGNTPYDVSNKDITAHNMFVNITGTLHPMSHVCGTQSDVGGAVGVIDGSKAAFEGYIHIDSGVGSSIDGSSIISGTNNVGGAVGHFGSIAPRSNSSGTAGINVDFSVSQWTIKGTTTDSASNANVGGAVGYFDNYWNNNNYSTEGYIENNTFPVTVDLGSSTVSSAGKNVGGAIGFNLIRCGNITVTSGGTISGKQNVGGAIGYNRADLNSITVNILGSGKVLGGEENDTVPVSAAPLKSTKDYDGSNVGGAVGLNHSAVAVGITANISGEVFGYGNNVGGCIGLCYASDNTPHWIESIIVTLQGKAEVLSESNSVGGALGYTLGSIRNLDVKITGQSKVKGCWRVGGAIGFASCIHQTDNKASKSGAGVILNCKTTVSADNALTGLKRIGGVVGQVSYKDEGTTGWTYAVFGDVTIEINSSTLFDPYSTGPEDPTKDAQAGGVIGLFSDGALGVVHLEGSGGTVHVDYPDHTYANSVLVSARGRSVGGIAGQIGMEGRDPATFISTVNLGENYPDLCVVSVNGADRIGGWFGSTFGQYGGLGDRTTVTTYDVKNVRVVYSTGSAVGGAVGYMDLDHGSNNRTVYANIDVTLSEAAITGSSAVGGAIGRMGYGILHNSGRINVTLSNHTNIGDIDGNLLPGDTSNYPRICYEAGGAIGRVIGKSGRAGELNLPITVQIDSTSRVAGLGEPESGLADYGVGGAIGSLQGLVRDADKVKDRARIRVDSDMSVVSVISSHSNVGGCVGVIDGDFTNSGGDEFSETNPVNHHWANVSVQGDGDNIGVGGFAGLVISSSGVNRSHSTGSVTATGSGASAGGFAGILRKGKITNSYTTSVVNSSGSCTGGFVGSSSNDGTYNIENCYVGGHTYEGQYVAGEGNITGVNNVGGFIGIINGNVNIKNCYSTASVLGKGENTGGFVGNYSVDNGSIDNCYCTGRVIGLIVTEKITNESGVEETVQRYADTVGAFAGFSKVVNDNRYKNTNKVMEMINGGELSLVGSVDGATDVVPANKQITFAPQSSIASGNSIAYPYDHSLLSDPSSSSVRFPLSAVLGNEHHGDWPLPVNAEKDISKADIRFVREPAEYVYKPGGIDVDDIKNDIIVEFEGNQLVLDTDYTLSCLNNTKAGTATVVIAGKTGSDYKGSVTKTFVINPADITGAVVTLSKSSYEYTGAPIVPSSTELTVKVNDVTLTKDDYFLTYDREPLGSGDNDNTRIGKVFVTINGTGNYTGTITNNTIFFDIIGMSLKGEDIVLSLPSNVYTGEPIVPTVVVRAGGKTLTAGTDYNVEFSNNINVGENTAIVTVEGINNYSGTETKKFSIVPAQDKWEEEPSILDWTYGSPNEPSASAKSGYDVKYTYYTDSALQNLTTAENSGAEEEGGKPANIGTYYVKATVEREENDNSTDDKKYYNYTEMTPVIKSFKITKADISSAEVGFGQTGYHQHVVNGHGELIQPNDISVKMNDTDLVIGTDYEIIYPDSTEEPGKYSIEIRGIGNYEGSITDKTYDIVRYYYVEFVTGVDGVEFDTQDIKVGEKASEPVNTREGYTVVWYRDSDCTIPYDFDMAITTDTKLYAKWTEVEEPDPDDNNDGADSDDPAPENNGNDESKPSPDPEADGN